jgi:hypothetical protein
MAAMMVENRKRIPAGGARFQGHTTLIAEFQAIARNTYKPMLHALVKRAADLRPGQSPIVLISTLQNGVGVVGFHLRHCYDARGGGVCALMGNSQGRDNARKRARRRKKTERLALAKAGKEKAKK